MDTLPFATSLHHLLAELARLDLLIQAQVWRARQLQGAGDEFQGLYISEQELDALLARPAGLPAWATAETPLSLPDLHAALVRLRTEIDAGKVESACQGIELRLERLAAHFHLTSFEVDLLLVALAPELDLRYEKLYAYLQDDVTKKRPSVDLALNLLCPSLEAKVAGRQLFGQTALLRKHHLLRLLDDPAQPHPPLLSQFLKVDERVVDYLLGGDALDTRLAFYATLITPTIDLETLLLPADWKSRLLVLVRQELTKTQGFMLYFQGVAGVGKQSTAEALCCTLGRPLLVIDGARLLQHGAVQNGGLQFPEITDIIIREALLQNAVIYWTAFDALLVDDKQIWYDLLMRAFSRSTLVTIVTGNLPWEPTDAFNTLPFMRIEFPHPTYTDRVHLWARALQRLSPDQQNLEEANAAFRFEDLDALASKFRLTAGQIADAASTAYQVARWRRDESVQITIADLHAACRLHSNRKLAEVAQKITPHYTWADLVLSVDAMQQLREICNYVTYRSTVYETWGFDRKLAMGKGLNTLFAGPSGTGKTMAAEVIANELMLDLYKIDLSAVVSKYIGETEKNLARIFQEAETSNAILFFDEADALFGKRSEVRDAHDRYANIEVAYLLQKMEAYTGVVILATNFRRNMDDAFVRRLHFTVEFPFPTAADRLRIWSQIWPPETLRDPTVDLQFLAERLELTGGHIRNIALAAAFLAAADGAVVTMTHLIRATEREYQKMGKIMMAGEWGAYAKSR